MHLTTLPLSHSERQSATLQNEAKDAQLSAKSATAAKTAIEDQLTSVRVQVTSLEAALDNARQAELDRKRVEGSSQSADSQGECPCVSTAYIFLADK